MDNCAPIPNIALPDADNVRIVSNNEPLVCISDKFHDLMAFQPKYFERGVPGATRHMYVRQTVSEMLWKAAHALPAGFQLKIYDAWRPARVQKALFDEYYSALCQAQKGSVMDAQKLREQALLFVSYPSDDPDTPFVHSTGGAVDLTIVDASGKELNMGTAFDSFSDAAHTAYFENSSNHEVRDNRRLLYHTMLSVGFTNYPAEWWHYDFGDRFWAAMRKETSFYKGIYHDPADFNAPE